MDNEESTRKTLRLPLWLDNLRTEQYGHDQNFNSYVCDLIEADVRGRKRLMLDLVIKGNEVNGKIKKS